MPPAAPSSAPPPPPPTWTSLPSPQRSGMVSLSIPSLAFWSRALGFVLLFIGTLVAVAFASAGSGCFSTNPDCGLGSGFLTGAANALLAAKILWAIGLFFVGAGAGIKLHWGLGRSSSATPEEVRATIHDRWFNGILVLTSIVLLWLLLAATLTTLAGFGL